VYKNRILVFGLFAMLFIVLTISLSTISYATGINVSKRTTTEDNYSPGSNIQFVINLTNIESSNITHINITDTYNCSCLTNYTWVNIPPNSSSNGSMTWEDLPGTPLNFSNNITIYVNFTVLAQCNTTNNVSVNSTNGTQFFENQGSYNFIVGGDEGPEDNWNQGLNSWQSSIVSPYLIRNEAKLINFSIYREAGEQSCLKNLTITYPSSSNFTFHGQNFSSIDSSNYTTFNLTSNSITWNATGDDFFCGSGPQYFAINVTSNASYGSGIFTVSAYANESTQNDEINLTFFTTTTFNYGGTVYDINGSLLPGAVASITVLTFGDTGDITIGTFSNTTDANGVFNITDIAGLDVSIDEDDGFKMGEEGGLLYRLSATKYNDTPTNHYAMYVGPSLPELPEIELRSDWGLKNASIYLKPAVTFYITVEGRDYKSGPSDEGSCTDGSCPDTAFSWTNIGFSYGLKDSTLGYPVSSDFSSSATERYFAAPSDRDYSLMVFPEASFPIYVDFTDIETKCNTTGYNISATGVNATCTKTNGTYFINATIAAGQNITPLTGYIGHGTFEELWIIPYMLGGGNMLFDQDTLPFNMGQMMRWPTNNTAYDDSYNKSTGEYSIYLPATMASSDIMLMAFAKNDSNYYHDLYKLSSEGKKFLNGSEFNFTLNPLINGTDKTLTSNNISAEWNQTTIVNTTAVQFQLVSNGSVLTADSSFVEMKLETSSIEYMRMVNAQNGVFTLPVIYGGSIKKLTIYSQSYAPVSAPISASVLSGATHTDTITCNSGVCNITLSRFDLFDPTSNESIDMWMDFYKSNSTCDVPSPPAGCNMMGEDNGEMNKTDFSPLKAILMGDVSLRITSGNISVHYVKTDLLASGPPDAAFSQNSTGTDLNAAWKFGSKGPEIYDYVLISMPYADTLSDKSIKITIPLLYNNEFHVIWNSSAGDNTTKIETNDTLEDYRDYLNSDYAAYLNGTGVNCSTADSNLSIGLCYADVENQLIWIKIPHFSGVGPEIITNDTTAPVITEISTSGTSSLTSSGTATITATTNENTNCWYKNSTFDASDTTGATAMTGTSTSHTFTVGYSSSTTIGPYFISCRDTAGNNMTTSNSTGDISVTVTTSTGGGGSSTPTVTYEEKTVGTLAAGSTKAVAFTKSATLAVTEITVTVKNAVTNAKIKVDTGSLPSGASVPSSAGGGVYKYLTMTKTAMTDDDISKAIIKFKIKKSWLTDKGYGKDTIALHRYYNNKWTKLTTTRDSQDTTYYYYSSESPGFSTFAITAEKAPAVIASPEEPEEEASPEEPEEEASPEEGAPAEEEEELEEETKSNTALIITLIAVVITLAVVGYFVQQKKKKY